MDSIYDLVNQVITDVVCHPDYKKLDDFIQNEKASQKFINSLNKCDIFDTDVDNDDSIFNIAQNRARHSAITFLLGLVLWKFGGLKDKIETTNVMEGFDKQASFHKAYRLWLMASLNHDYAYYSKYLKNPEADYSKIVRYHLFNDQELDLFGYQNNKEVLRYSYKEILQYDKWARQFHKQHNDDEKVDHGILGGVLVFDRYIRNFIKTKETSQYTIKAASLTIAQHNMFKSSEKEQDEINGVRKPRSLRCGSKSKITFKTPLLLLLSIVDTIECVKRFRKGKNPEKYATTIHVLKTIDMAVDESKIVIDYTRCLKKGEFVERLFESFENYRRSVKGMDEWTCLRTRSERSDDNIIVLSLR